MKLPIYLLARLAVAGLLCCFLFNSCRQPTSLLRVTSSKLLEGLPSASGLVWLSGTQTKTTFLAIGDDAPYLYVLDSAGQISRKIPIFPTSMAAEDGRIPKPIKPDFEAIELIEGRELLIFGSGSKWPQRNILVQLDWPAAKEIVTYDLSEFYAQLLALPEMQGYELNIEGLACYEEQLYLLNRSNNLVFRFAYADWMASLQAAGPMPAITVFSISLPFLGGYPAQLTGATIGGAEPQLFFTATVEATDNAYDDGEILGSFFGQVPLDRLAEGAAYCFQPIQFGDKPLKVESLALRPATQPTHFYFVTDSDGGPSLLLEGILKQP